MQPSCAKIQTMKKRVVFMGSPDFALPSLNALIQNYYVTGVVTQPDKPAGRGRSLKPPPVKTLANQNNIPVIQPVSLKEPETLVQLQAWNPDIIVVAAFGQILRSPVLNLPPYGCINVHASLLPRWRGAAPIQAAILNGDEQTGVTIMIIDPGLDTGPILSQRAIAITEEHTAGTLSPILADLGAQLLIETLPDYLSGELKPQPQDETRMTYAPMLKKADGELDFNKPAEYLERFVRAYNPWPGAFTSLGAGRMKVHRAHDVDSASPGVGIRIIHNGQPAIGTAQGILVLDEVQPAGKKAMPGDVFLRGARDWSD